MSSNYLPPSKRPATGLFRPNGSRDPSFVNSPAAEKERRRQANYEDGVRSRNGILQIPHANYRKMTSRMSPANKKMANELRNHAHKNIFHAFEEQRGKMPGTLYAPGAFGNKPVINTRGTSSTAAPSSGLHAPSAVTKGGRRGKRNTRRTRRSH